MISQFSDEHEFLSNFFKAPMSLPLLGTVRDVEHAYQAMKAVRAQDRNYVLAAAGPEDAKRRGREIECRTDWDAVKRRYMHSFVLAKFVQHPELQEKLAATGGQTLVEGNSWGDTYWGAVLKGQKGWSAELPWLGPPGEPWSGLNYLGKILMGVRMILC